MIGSKRTKQYFARLSHEHPKLVRVYNKYVKENIDFNSYHDFLQTIKNWSEIEHNLEKQRA